MCGSIIRYHPGNHGIGSGTQLPAASMVLMGEYRGEYLLSAVGSPDTDLGAGHDEPVGFTDLRVERSAISWKRERD